MKTITNKIVNVTIAISLIGVIILSLAYFFNWVDKQSDPKYPIRVEWIYNKSYQFMGGTIECDSVKGDTIWKDGKWIINKNIVNITFK